MDVTLREFFSQTTRIISHSGTIFIENDPISRVYKYIFTYYTGKYVVIPGVRYMYSYGLKLFSKNADEFDNINQNNVGTQTCNPKTYFGI